MPTAVMRRGRLQPWFTSNRCWAGPSGRFITAVCSGTTCDGIHVYRFDADLLTTGRFNYGQAKVGANFKAMVGNTIFVSEAFDDKPIPTTGSSF